MWQLPTFYNFWSLLYHVHICIGQLEESIFFLWFVNWLHNHCASRFSLGILLLSLGLFLLSSINVFNSSKFSYHFTSFQLILTSNTPCPNPLFNLTSLIFHLTSKSGCVCTLNITGNCYNNVSTLSVKWIVTLLLHWKIKVECILINWKNIYLYFIIDR